MMFRNAVLSQAKLRLLIISLPFFLAATTLAEPVPPNPPTALKASGDANSIHLSWSAPVESNGSELTGYQVDVSKESDFSTRIPGWDNNPIGLVTTIEVAGLDSSTTYYTRLRAVDQAGLFSEYSNSASATTYDTQAPTPPANLTFSFGPL
jgi:hypothetical protein